jgi:hypothetical protein
MTIKGIEHDTDVLEELKRLDHVWFSLPIEGGKAALDHPREMGGYSFLHYVSDEFTLPLTDAPSVDFSAETLGTRWDHHDEETDVWFHGVYNHSMVVGWHPAVYEIVQRRLDDWWEEHEDEVVRPMRSLILGDGRNLRKIAEDHGGTNWNHHLGYGVLANTEAEFRLFWQKD